MENINDRFRVIEEYMGGKDLISSMLVEDTFQADMKMMLYLIDEILLDAEVYHSLIELFPYFRKFSSAFFLRPISFERVKEIDHLREKKEYLLYTSEIKEQSEAFSEWLREAEISEIVNAVFALLRGFNEALFYGVEYSAFRFSNIMVTKENDELKFYHRDIISSDILMGFSIEEKRTGFLKRISFSKSPGDIDYKKITAMILSMIEKKKEVSFEDIDSRLQSYRERMDFAKKFENFEIHLRLLDFLDKLYYGYFESDYTSFSKVFGYFARNCGKDTRVFLNADRPSINALTPIIGKREELNKVMAFATSTEPNENSANVIVINGNKGVGKSRFLQEVNFRLQLQGVSVFYAKNPELIRDFNTELVKEVSKWIEEVSSTERRKVNYKRLIEVRNSLLETEKGLRGDFATILKNSLKTFIEFTHDKKIVFLLDNFGKTTKENIEFVIDLMGDSSLKDKLLFVLSIDDEDTYTNSDFNHFLHTVRGDKILKEFNFTDFNEHYFKIFMHVKLANVCENSELYDYVYKKTSGNANMISELLSQAILRESLYIDEFSGMWYFSSSNMQDKNFSEEDYIKSNFKLLNDTEEAMLFTIALVGGEIELKRLGALLEVDEKEVYFHTQRLNEYNLIAVRPEGLMRYFKIASELIRTLVLSEAEENQKLRMHERILDSLDIQNRNDLIESIMQYEYLGKYDKAVSNLRRLIKQYNYGNFKQIILCYKRIEGLMIDATPDEKAELYLEEVAVFIRYTRFEEAREVLGKAFALYNKTKVPGIKEWIIFRMGELLYYVSDYSTRQRDLIKMFKEIPLSERTSDYDFFLMYLRGNYYITIEELDKGKALYYELISIYENKDIQNKPNDYIMADVYRFYALVRADENVDEDAEYQILIGFLIQSIKCSVNIQDHRGAYASALNVASVYKDKKFEYYQAIDLLEVLLAKVKESTSSSFEIIFYKELAEGYTLAGEPEKALQNLFMAERRMEYFGSLWIKPLIYSRILLNYLNMGYYTEFQDFYHSREEEIENLENFGEKQSFLDMLADYYFSLGQFGRATNYTFKSLLYVNNYADLAVDDERRYRYEIFDSLISKKFSVYKVLNYLDFIKERIPSQFQHRHYLRQICNLILMLRNKIKFEELKILLERMLDFLETPMTELLQTYAYFLKSLMYNDNYERKLYYLQKALMKENIGKGNSASKVALNSSKIKTSIRSNPLYALIQLEIAKILFSYGKNVHGINQLTEALAEVMRMLSHVPVEYKVSFINSYGFQELMFYCRAYILHEKDVLQRGLDAQIASKELFKILEDVENMNTKTDFLNSLTKVRLMQYGFPERAEDLTKLFDSRRERNIDLLLNFFLIKLLATQGYVIAGSKGESYKVLSFCDSNFSYEFDRISDSDKEKVMIDVRALMNVVSTNKITLLKGDNIIPEYPRIHNLISYPMDIGQGRRKETDFCFMIFISDSIINRFDELQNNYQYIEGVLMMNQISGYFLKMRASKDPLTGVLTRKYLEDNLEKFSYSLKQGKKGAVVIMDLDKFKNINDTYGHQVGDMVLKEVVKTASMQLPNIEIGRYGGEEFVFIIPDADMETAFEVSEKVRKAVSNIVFQDFKDLRITVSLGIALFKEWEDYSIKDMIKMADKALYEAKNSGRNRSVIYTQSLGERTTNISPLYGVVRGDEIGDSGIFDTLIEIVLMKSEKLEFQDKIFNLIKRTVQILGADEGGLVLENQGELEFYSKPEKDNILLRAPLITPYEYREVKLNGSKRLIDWNQSEDRDKLTKMPLWKSFIGSEIRKNDCFIGAIYLRSLFLEHAFSDEDMAALRVVSEIVAMLL